MKSILIADDDPVMVKLVEFNLKKIGYSALICRDGDSVRERALSEKPVLAIFDFMLPGRSGLELIVDFKADPVLQDIPLLVVTAQGKDSVREEVLAAGAARVFTKPFSPTLLTKCIDELLEPLDAVEA